MKARIPRAALAAALLAVVAVSPASAQLDPRDRPTVSGPLGLGDRLCQRDAIEAPDGQIGVVTRVCIYAYTFDPNEETNNGRDFGAAWVQAQAVPKNGWCLNRVKTDVINQNDDISAKAPRIRKQFSRNRGFTTRLRSNANGDATTHGLIKNKVWMRKGMLRGVTRNNGKTYRLIWRGATDKPVAFTVGIEVNWNANNNNFVFSPTGGVLTRLQDNC